MRNKISAGFISVLLLSGLVYLLHGWAWPLSPGRDFISYLIGYSDRLGEKVLFPMIALYRAPLAVFFVGYPLDHFGPVGMVFLLGLLFVLSVTAYFSLSLLFDTKTGIVFMALLLLYPSYGWLFHSVSSDAPFAFGYAGWLYLTFRACRQPSGTMFALNAVMVFILILIKPISQIFALFVLAPFIIGTISLRYKIKMVGVFSSVLIVLVSLYSLNNYLRFDDFTVSRGSKAWIPMYRLFIIEDKVDAENGPYSGELARVVKKELLSQEPYLSYGIDIKTYFHSRNTRMMNDLIGLSDRVWGWDSDYDIMRKVAIEAIQKDTGGYLAGVVRATWKFLKLKYFPEMSASDEGSSGEKVNKYIKRGNRILPKSTEGQLIPGSRLWWLASTPDGRISYDWSNLSRPTPVFRANDARIYEAMQERVNTLSVKIKGEKGGNKPLDRVLSQISRFYPGMHYFMFFGVLGFIFLRGNVYFRMLSFHVALILVILLVTASSLPFTFEYRAVFDPVFILFGVVGGVGLVRYMHKRFWER